MKLPVRLRFNFRGGQDPDTDDRVPHRRATSGAACSEQITRRVEGALTRARLALARQQAARSCFTLATKRIEEGASHVADLVAEFRTALAQLSEELNKG